MAKKINKQTKKKRYVLGKGYPWYGDDNTQPSRSRTVKLCEQRNGYGIVIPLNIRDTGAFKKYKLILEEI